MNLKPLAGVLLFSYALLWPQAPVNLLPADNAVSGWIRSVSGACKQGSAVDSNGLYGIIDGGADVYTNRGYLGSAYQGYTANSVFLCVEIYNQGVHDSALSVFNYFSFVQFDTLIGLGDTAKLDTTPVTLNKIEMVTGPYFVRIYIKSKNRSLISAGRLFAQAVAGNSIGVERNKRRLALTRSLKAYPIPAVRGCTIETAFSGALFQNSCDILNCRGEKVASLKFKGNDPEEMRAFWNGTDDKGGFAPTGVYFARTGLGSSGRIIRFVFLR